MYLLFKMVMSIAVFVFGGVVYHSVSKYLLVFKEGNICQGGLVDFFHQENNPLPLPFKKTQLLAPANYSSWNSKLRHSAIFKKHESNDNKI